MLQREDKNNDVKRNIYESLENTITHYLEIQ